MKRKLSEKEKFENWRNVVETRLLDITRKINNLETRFKVMHRLLTKPGKK